MDAGLFVANFDMTSIRLAECSAARRRIIGELRRGRLEYDGRRRLVICRGRRSITLPFRYLGADDHAGPNYTGQPAVNSYYEEVKLY
jgi:hypothetical protein